jgi:deoxyribodipyrimidine photo-lyase
MRGIVWFKKDLRVNDNPALFHACKQCSDGVVAVYIIDPEMWIKHKISARQIDFILRGLTILREDLENIDIPLLIHTIDKTNRTPAYLFSLMEQLQAEKLFFNREYEVNEAARDKSVVEYVNKNRLGAEIYEEQLILPHQQIKTGAGDYFKVFTPFKRQWLKVFSQSSPKKFSKPKSAVKIIIDNVTTYESAPYSAPHFDSKLWPAGEQKARSRLDKFLKDDGLSYDKQRDFPALAATSQLSPYLAVGMISAKECFLAALTMNSRELDTGNKGMLTWMSELIWREFYRHILIYVPRICMDKAYNAATEALPWRYSESLLKAWQHGQTGFPLVDAAMRQLNSIGWMHNRLRMVVAMFLSKNLFLDWRLGEQYFTEKLIDIDFASNNGGWQWSASTGTDAVPYFRIFNPTTQSQRFDPTGEFIRQYCPELKQLNAKQIHEPYKYLQGQIDYPHPIIDYKKSREYAIQAFKALS